MIDEDKVVPITLGQFRQATEHLPDETELYVQGALELEALAHGGELHEEDGPSFIFVSAGGCMHDGEYFGCLGELEHLGVQITIPNAVPATH